MPALLLSFAFIIAFVIVVAAKTLPFVVKIVSYVTLKIFAVICFVTEKFFTAVSWIISASIALAFGFYAFGRQFFTGENAKIFIAEKLPTRYDLSKRSFSLLIIELMLVFHDKIFSETDSFNTHEQN